MEKVRDVIEADDAQMAEKLFRAKYPATTKILELDDGFYPMYVAVGEIDGIALKLERDNENKPIYYRIAGDWSCSAKMIEGKPFVNEPDGILSHLNNQPLIEINKKKWAEDNRGYTGEDEGQLPTTKVVGL